MPRITQMEGGAQDLDLDVQVEVGGAQRAALLEQVARDTQLLEKLHIMDYSLLLGLHFPSWGASTWRPPPVHLVCPSCLPPLRSGPRPRHLGSGFIVVAVIVHQYVIPLITLTSVTFIFFVPFRRKGGNILLR